MMDLTASLVLKTAQLGLMVNAKLIRNASIASASCTPVSNISLKIGVIPSLECTFAPQKENAHVAENVPKHLSIKFGSIQSSSCVMCTYSDLALNIPSSHEKNGPLSRSRFTYFTLPL